MHNPEKFEYYLTGAFTLLTSLLLTAFIIVGCSAPRHVTQLVESVQKDTVYLSNVQYDSIYIMQDKFVDRSRDTLYINDKSIEYRYKLLRDTVRIVQLDSIPYEVTVVETKEFTRPLTWFDHLTRACFFFLLGAIGLNLIHQLCKLRKL